MADSFRDSRGRDFASDDHLMTSWARISLDFGYASFENFSENTESFQSEIEQMIGTIKQMIQPQESSVNSREPEVEFEQQVQQASAEDVVQALMLAGVDLPEIMVYEADDSHVDVYVLCMKQGEKLVTAQLHEAGKLEPGTEFYEDFATRLLDQLPVRGGLCAEEESYLVSAPVTALGELVSVDADARVAALVDIEMPRLPLYMAELELLGSVQAVPVDNGWTLISADSHSLLLLLQQIRRPAVLAESTGSNYHLSFILPGSSSSQAREESRSERPGQRIGVAKPGDIDSGAVIDLVWGAPKTLTRYLPQHSYAVDNLWSLPGNLPDPLNCVRMNNEIESLTWVYGLDSSSTNRLRNYVEDSHSELGMESVLQLLNLPHELAKVALGNVDISMLEGARRFGSNMNAGKAMGESAFTYPNGLGVVSAVNREIVRRPWIVVVDGAGQLTASGLLALVALRRRASGKPYRVATLGAVTLLGSGLTDFAAYRFYRRVHRLHRGILPDGSHRDRELSLTEELRRSAGQGARSQADSLESGLDRIEQMGRVVLSYLKLTVRRFRR